jgi:X-X-X-Leu-X-X-Gly heptad repeat protein
VPTLDDEFLDTLLHEVGGSFAVPTSGASGILARVQRDDDERAGLGHAAVDRPRAAGPTGRTSRRTIPQAVRAHRVSSVAAAVLVLLIVAAGAVQLGSGTPKVTSGLHAAPAAPSRRTGDAPDSKAAGSTSSAGSTAAVPNAASAAPTQNGVGFSAASLGQPARIEQTGSLDLRVARGALSATVDRLTALAGTNGGFVANSQTYSGTAGGGGPSGAVTLQVPVASFSAVLSDAKSLGRVSELTTKATDVTGRYVDLQERIAALEASRQQYLTIMTKAYSIGDVLAVQAQLESLQTQIEEFQGELAVLGSETDYSTLTVEVSEPGLPVHHPAAVVHSGLARAWHDSVHGFLAGGEGLIRIAGPALFALLCLAAVLLGGQLFWRRLQRHYL